MRLHRLFITVLFILTLNTLAQIQVESIEREDWNALFERYSGWTGADGIFTIPLGGYDSPTEEPNRNTLILFSDTFVGEVNPQTGARENARFINNSLAQLSGSEPDTNNIEFIHGLSSGEPASVFVPQTPFSQSRSDLWYWLQDGVATQGNVYILASMVEPNADGSEGFQFREIAVGMIKIPISTDGTPDISSAQQMDTPLFSEGAFFGPGIFANTAEAGAPDPDGYLYVYGRRSGSLLVARVLSEDIEDFSSWRFFANGQWVVEIDQASSLGPGGAELSVSPVRGGPYAGKYILFAMEFRGDLWYRIGDTPSGPFTNPVTYYSPGETGEGVYVYNSKAHPHLSSNGNWLVSYNVNTTSWDENMANGHIYRPRFVEVRLFEPSVSIFNNSKIDDTPKGMLFRSPAIWASELYRINGSRLNFPGTGVFFK